METPATAMSVDTHNADHPIASAEAASMDAAAAAPSAIAATPASPTTAAPDASSAVTPTSAAVSSGKIVILKKRSTLNNNAATTAVAAAPTTPTAVAVSAAPTTDTAAAAAASTPEAPSSSTPNASSSGPESKVTASTASPPLSPTAATAAALSSAPAPISPAVDHRAYPPVSAVIQQIEKQSSLTHTGAATTVPAVTKKYTLTRKTTAGQTAAAAAPPETATAATPAAASTSAASSPLPSPTTAAASVSSSSAVAATPAPAPVPALVSAPVAVSATPDAAAAPAAPSATASSTSASVTAAAVPAAIPVEIATAAAPLPASLPPAAPHSDASVGSPTEVAPAPTAVSAVTTIPAVNASDVDAAPIATPVTAIVAATPSPAVIPAAAAVVPLTPQKPLAVSTGASTTSPVPQLVSPGAVAVAVETPLRAAPPVFASSGALEFSSVVPAEPASAVSLAPSRARTPVLLEPLPPLSSSRRGSIDASAAPAFAGSAGLFTDSASGQPPPHHYHGHTSGNFSMDLPTGGSSRSRRTSLNRGTPLPPLHSSTPPPQNLTPRMPGTARTGTPDEPISPSLQSPPDASSRRHGKSPSGVPASGSRREQQLHSRGASAAPALSEFSPSAAAAASQSRRSSRVFVSPMLNAPVRPSTGAALASQLQEVRVGHSSLIQLQESVSSRANPWSRWLWCGFACFGLAWLAFALVYALAHPDGGYSRINPAGDRLVLACAVLYALGLGCMMYVAVLFWRRVSPYTSAAGFLLQLGLTLAMLGLAGLISNQSRSAVLSVLGATPVLVATQAAFVGVCLLFVLFTRWVYGSPSRTTAAVLSLLEGLDLSTLNRDVRTLKGMNSELIKEHTALVVRRGMRLGHAPTGTTAAQGATAATMAAATNEPVPGHTRPGTALLEGNLPAYALGSYDSPVAGRIVSGASSTRTKDKKRNRSSVGRLNLPADALHSEAALVLPAPSNFALPATTSRRSSVDGVAMKQMMATNLQLQAKVRDLESQQQGPNWKA